MRAVARAHPNIALIKYWGKRDEALVLPMTGSLSLTLDIFPTTTSVELDALASADIVELGGETARGTAAERVTAFLDIVRRLAGSSVHARVSSRNTAPTGAGLASSAAGFAALAVAASAAYGLDLDGPALSRLARRGSGSAARSIVPGLAIWHEGDDEHSYAEPVPGPDLGMVIATLDARPKTVSSRVAMRASIDTSPFFPGWVDSTRRDLAEMLQALAAGDIERVGALTESNALRMHGVMAAARPPIRYLSPQSVRVFDLVSELRSAGLAAYATADAGPNVAVLAPAADLAAVRDALASEVPAAQLSVAHAGPGARLVGATEAAS
ncbi:diphosphomevalonate decarboxylase [Microbacterium sp. STN6]|uniref:diphosphomevalonate decarboxylase n=1 Tax=Microbacterium sp. STN6 TaxID=2995588 RepID=UPI002260D8FA|nr:diphosphomevalonate decarboxylase [Microbacterium sp. STN6]MCX7521889.1 diphosphomevalonate decarboxylase [Microbacterium sp. STN6]